MKSDSYYDQLIHKAGEKLIPISVQLELTHLCNLHCIHCFIGSKRSEQKELSTLEIFKLLDELADEGCLFLTLTGGEILIRKDFFAIAEFARKKQFALRLLTNGTLMTESIADRIAEVHPLSVEVSVLGSNPQTHDSITRISGSFEQTMNALEMLKNRDVPIIIKTPVMKTNVEELEQIETTAMRQGADFICDPKIIPRIDGSTDTLSLCVDEKELDAVVSVFGAKSEKNKISHRDRLGLYICAAGRRTACISPTGVVFPCSLWRIPCGSLTKDNFGQIWMRSSVLQEVRSVDLKAVSKCASCKLLRYCSPCMGIGFLEKNIFRADSAMTCQVAKIKKKLHEESANDQTGFVV